MQINNPNGRVYELNAFALNYVTGAQTIELPQWARLVPMVAIKNHKYERSFIRRATCIMPHFSEKIHGPCTI